MKNPMDDRVIMNLSEREKRFIIAYRKARSDVQYSINVLLGVEERRPQLQIVKDNNTP